jgi:hypothetical protein
MSKDGSSSVIISASATFMAQSQHFIADAAAPTPPPTPGSPTPSPLSLFKVTPQKFVNGKPEHDYAFTANNLTLETCAAKCIEIGCDAFDYDPTWLVVEV